MDHALKNALCSRISLERLLSTATDVSNDHSFSSLFSDKNRVYVLAIKDKGALGLCVGSLKAAVCWAVV